MTDEELIKRLADQYNETKSKIGDPELYMGYYKNTKTLIPVDLNNLDYYNNLLKPYNLRMELHPEEEDYVIIFDSSYKFDPNNF